MLGLGATTLIVTNAAGGINRYVPAGDLMLIDDHINLMGRNPLTGPVSTATRGSPTCRRRTTRRCSCWRCRWHGRGGALVRGVYARARAQLRDARGGAHAGAAGRDAVGMSTVPEVLVARARGVPVLGISLMSNAAAGLQRGALSHDEVWQRAVKLPAAFTAGAGDIARLATQALPADAAS
jgi:purine-nucleoside phosphorylase